MTQIVTKYITFVVTVPIQSFAYRCARSNSGFTLLSQHSARADTRRQHAATVSAGPRSSSEGQADPASTKDQRQHDKSAENKTGRRQRPAQGPGFDEFGVDEQAAEHNERQRCCDEMATAPPATSPSCGQQPLHHQGIGRHRAAQPHARA
jgi:hypothetical protein